MPFGFESKDITSDHSLSVMSSVSSVRSFVMLVMSSHMLSEFTEFSTVGSDFSDPLSLSVHHLLSVGSEFGFPDSPNMILLFEVHLLLVDDSVYTVDPDHEVSVMLPPDSLGVVLLPVDFSDPTESVSSGQSSLESVESELESSAVMSSMTSSVSSASHVMFLVMMFSFFVVLASLGFVFRSLSFGWLIFFLSAFGFNWSWSSFLGCWWSLDLFNLLEGSAGGFFSTYHSCSDQGA